MDGQDRTFHAIFEIGAGHDDRNFNDAIHLRIEARHLAVKPNEVFVGFAE